MPLLPMHPTLGSAFQHYRSGEQFTFVRADKTNDLEDILINIIAENLQQSKSTLIISNQESDPAWPAKILSSISLSQYCLVWTQEYLDKQKPLERIRAFSPKSEIDFRQDEYRVTLNQRDDIRSIMDEYTSRMYQRAFGKYTWKDLLHLQCQMEQTQNLTPEYNLSEFRQETEIKDFLSAIAEVEKDFQNHYAVLIDVDLFNPKLFADEGGREMINEELQDHLEGICELKSLYAEHYDRLRKKIRSEIEQEYLGLSSMFLKLGKHLHRLENRQLENAARTPKVGSLCSAAELREIQNLLEEHSNQIRQFKYLDFGDEPPHKTQMRFEELKMFLNELGIYVQDIQQKIEDQTVFHLKRFSPFNADDERLKNLETRLDSFIEKLNDSGIFKKTFLNNSLNLGKKIELLRDVERDILKAIAMLESFPDYYDWRTKMHVNSVEEAVVEELIFSSQSWKSEARRSLVSGALRKHYHPCISSIAAEIGRLVEKENELYELRLKKIHWATHQMRLNAVEELRTQSQYLFKELFKAQGPTTLKTAETFFTHRNLFDAFYPVLLTSDKYVSDLLTPQQRWDTIVLIDMHVSYIKANNLNMPAKQAICLDPVTETKDADNPSNFRLNCPRIGSMRPLKHVPVAERHEMALAASKTLMDAAHCASIYCIRNVSIISLLPEEVENVITALFITQGIKCLHHKTQDVLALTESMVSADSEVFLLYENGMLSQDSKDRIKWHYHLLDHLRDGGIRRIDISSSDLYKDRAQLLKSVRQTILASLSQEKQKKEAEYAVA